MIWCLAKLLCSGIEPVILLSQPSERLILLFFLFIFFNFFAVPGIEPRGVLPPSYTPGPIFLCFILKPGLMKLRRASFGRERERDRERERERELRLATNPDPPVSASQSTGITSVRHHARPLIYFCVCGTGGLSPGAFNLRVTPLALLLF